MNGTKTEVLEKTILLDAGWFSGSPFHALRSQVLLVKH